MRGPMNWTDTLSTNLISDGGPLIWALLLCSVLALAVIMERAFSLRRSRIIRMDLLMEIEISLKEGHLKDALEVCKRVDSPMMRIVKVGLINYNKPKDELQRIIEDAGRLETPLLDRFLTLLQTIAVISPLLGLLGTVTGMISVFTAIRSQGVGDISNLAGGISEALVTTAAGLAVAIPTLVFFNLFSRKVENLINEMERNSLTMLDLLVRTKI